MSKERFEHLYASLSDLKQIYRMESDKIVKMAPCLSAKSSWPSSTEKQNANLCLKFFNESNISALSSILGQNAEGTTELLRILLTVKINFWR